MNLTDLGQHTFSPMYEVPESIIRNYGSADGRVIKVLLPFLDRFFTGCAGVDLERGLSLESTP